MKIISAIGLKGGRIFFDISGQPEPKKLELLEDMAQRNKLSEAILAFRDVPKGELPTINWGIPTKVMGKG